MTAEAEIWQVMCGPDVYQADLDTLKQWVVEGLVLPTDQVRKGNLRWLDAARVPALRSVFSGEETPAPPDPARAAQQHEAQDSHAQQQHARQPQHHAQQSQQQHAPSAVPAGAQAVMAGVYRADQAHAAAPPVSASDLAPPYVVPAGHVPYSAQAASAPYAVAAEPLPLAAPFEPAPAAAWSVDDGRDAAYAGFPAHDPFHAPAPGEGAAAEASFVPDTKDFAARAAAAPSLRALGTACYNHPQAAPRYVCRVCQTPMCADCAKYVGASRVALCPLCGDLCKPYEEVRTRAVRTVHKAGGFGLADFAQAVRYPLRNVVGLVGVSVLYSLLALGGIKGQVLAYVVIFGCMSLVIKQTAWGRFDRGFLPDFSAFSMWDDVAVPCFLGVGITLVTIGPAVVLLLALLFGVVGGGPSASERQAAAMEAHQQQFAEHTARVTDPDATPEEVEESLAFLQGQRAAALPGAEAEEESEAAVVLGLVSGTGGSILLVLLIVAALAWAFFYYPMALIVAGYTEDVWSVVNPLVGLDTIRRMGWNYAKAFGMYAGVQLAGVVFGAITMAALAAFDMPLVGNIPARFVQGTFGFYTSLVIAATLGLALYKSSDELGIETD